MRTLKNGLWITAGLLIVALAFGGTHVGQAAAQALKDVVIVNTASQPVPTAAQGTTAVSGTVSISNAPTVNLASGTAVGIAGTPIVLDATLASQPINLFGSFNLAHSVGEVGAADVFVVPAGKRFVVTYASFDGYLRFATGESALFSLSGCTDGSCGTRVARYFIPGTNLGVITGALSRVVGSQTLSFVLQAGQHLQVLAETNDPLEVSIVSYGLSGYLMSE
jgi:hypothetical protein